MTARVPSVSSMPLSQAAKFFPEVDLKEVLLARRREALELAERINTAQKRLEWVTQTLWNMKFYASVIAIERMFHAHPLHTKLRKLLWYIAELEVDAEGRDNLTQIEIERAKAVPFEKLIDTKKQRNYHLCPFHHEKTPSFWVKDNRCYCFGCGFGGDTIHYARKKYDLSFKDAVRILNQL